MNQKNKKTIEKLRQQQEATRGASDWTMLEEEIQELLAEDEEKDRDRIPDEADPYDNDEYARSYDEDESKRPWHREKNDAQIRHEDKVFGK
jgi:hypothetical protein